MSVTATEAAGAPAPSLIHEALTTPPIWEKRVLEATLAWPDLSAGEAWAAERLRVFLLTLGPLRVASRPPGGLCHLGQPGSPTGAGPGPVPPVLAGPSAGHRRRRGPGGRAPRAPGPAGSSRCSRWRANSGEPSPETPYAEGVQSGTLPGRLLSREMPFSRRRWRYLGAAGPLHGRRRVAADPASTCSRTWPRRASARPIWPVHPSVSPIPAKDAPPARDAPARRSTSPTA